MHSRAKYKPTGLLLVEVVLVVLAAEAHVTVVATAAAAQFSSPDIYTL